VTLDHDSTDALYVQLAELLRGQIERRELTGRVPSAKTLAQQYEVSVGTAERALAILRADGLIASAIGLGHFVVSAEGTLRAHPFKNRPDMAGSARTRPYRSELVCR
jgi:DNA-binding GntR family transcriptional regulator